ncbi:MAG TPA: hypothetical protein VLC95_19635, partial [Anaerolineae bacterium]|nr:hypothetical protein [Anaerolineae bacterium]
MTLEHSVQETKRARRVRWLGLLVAVTLARGLVYAAITPPWQAPDEPGHFEYVWLIAHSPTLGSIQPDPELDRELIASLYEWRYGELTGYSLSDTMPDSLEKLPAWNAVQRSRPVVAGRFSLSYVWPTLLLLAARFQDITVQLYLVRLSSILINVAIVWLAFRIFARLVPDRPDVAALMTAVIVFLPQHTFINSAAGDGPFAELMATLVLYGWVYVFQRGFSLWALLAIVGGTAAAIWSKTTAGFLVPLNVALIAWWGWRQPRREWRYRRALYALLAALVLVMTVVVWLQSPIGLYVGRAMGSLADDQLLLVDRRGLSVWDALLMTHDSFWAWFGWLTVPIGERWYGALLLLTTVAGAGWLVGRHSVAGVPRWGPVLMASAFGSAYLIFVWVAILNGSS